MCGVGKEAEQMSNWKTDLIAAAVAGALYLSIPGELSRVQSMIYIALYYAIAKAAARGIEMRNEKLEKENERKEKSAHPEYSGKNVEQEIKRIREVV